MTGVCHCKNCQRQAGSAFSTLAVVPRSDFKLTAGEPKLYTDGDTKQNWVELKEGVPHVATQSQPGLG